tara:strand:- start:376 stop:1428 length:1053 start_codon:yes stop_codon:yes gene_type:complete
MNDNSNFEDVLNTLSKQQETDDSQDNDDSATKEWIYDPKNNESRELLLNATADYSKKYHDGWVETKTDILRDILADEHWVYIILIIVGTQYRIMNTVDPSTGEFWESNSDYAKANKLNDQTMHFLIDHAITSVIGETDRDKIFEKIQTKYPYDGYLSKHGLLSSSDLLKPHEVNGVKNLIKELEYIAAMAKNKDLSRDIVGFMCVIATADEHIDETEQALITQSIKMLMIGIDREFEPDIKKISKDYLAEIEEENQTKAKTEKKENKAKEKAAVEAAGKHGKKAGEEILRIMGLGNTKLGEKAIISYPRLALTLFYFIFIIVNEIFISGLLVGVIYLVIYSNYKAKKMNK